MIHLLEYYHFVQRYRERINPSATLEEIEEAVESCLDKCMLWKPDVKRWGPKARARFLKRKKTAKYYMAGEGWIFVFHREDGELKPKTVIDSAPPKYSRIKV